MFGKIRRVAKAIVSAVRLLAAVLPTLLSPEMRSLYVNLAR